MQYYGTLGPACGEEKVLKAMFEAGMTGVRLNLSHGDLEENGHWLSGLSRAAREGGCEEAPKILIDLRGPEMRLGRLKKEIHVETGEQILLGGEGIPVPEAVLSGIACGDHILLDDGKLEFAAELLTSREQESCTIQSGHAQEKAHSGQRPAEVPGGILVRAVRGGIIKSEKSLAIVGKSLPMPTLTDSDYKNISQAARYGVTGVMLPFVRNREDLITLRRALSDAGAEQIEIFAKIENMQGVEAIDELLPYCDCVVIARGDLGNAVPLWKLPGVQKRLAARCRAAKKPFMVVTQMLDSMHERPVPTRAEVLDIYNAVLDGVSSLMLTGETAVGKYPVEAMEFLVKTGNEAGRDQNSFSQR